MMEKIDDTEDYMLYALLNGGAPYLIRDGAYPNFDGSFDGNVKMHIEEDIKRCKAVTDGKPRNGRWQSTGSENHICRWNKGYGRL